MKYNINPIKRRTINPGENRKGGHNCFSLSSTYLIPCEDCEYAARQSIIAYEKNLERKVINSV